MSENFSRFVTEPRDMDSETGNIFDNKSVSSRMRDFSNGNIETKLLDFKKKETNIKGVLNLLVQITSKIVKNLFDLRYLMSVKGEKSHANRLKSENCMKSLTNVFMQLQKVIFFKINNL